MHPREVLQFEYTMACTKCLVLTDGSSLGGDQRLYPASEPTLPPPAPCLSWCRQLFSSMCSYCEDAMSNHRTRSNDWSHEPKESPYLKPSLVGFWSRWGWGNFQYKGPCCTGPSSQTPAIMEAPELGFFKTRNQDRFSDRRGLLLGHHSIRHGFCGMQDRRAKIQCQVALTHHVSPVFFASCLTEKERHGFLSHTYYLSWVFLYVCCRCVGGYMNADMSVPWHVCRGHREPSAAAPLLIQFARVSCSLSCCVCQAGWSGSIQGSF